MTKKTQQPLACEQCFASPFCNLLAFNANHVVCQCFDANTTLIRAGDPFRHFYIVKQGVFKKISVSEDGREQILAFYFPGEVIGLGSVGFGEYQFSVVALERESVVCEIDAKKLLSFVRDNPEVYQQWISLTSQQFHDMDVVPRNARAKEKLVAFLLNLIERYHLNKEGVIEFQLHISRQDIGNYLGLTIETVSRLFSELKQQSVLNVHGKVLRILDIKKLSLFSRF